MNEQYPVLKRADVVRMREEMQELVDGEAQGDILRAKLIILACMYGIRVTVETPLDEMVESIKSARCELKLAVREAAERIEIPTREERMKPNQPFYVGALKKRKKR